MNCPRCKHELTPVLTRRGVVVDVCRSCKGVWLDHGEILHFVDRPEKLGGLQLKPDQRAKGAACPRCTDEVTVAGRLVDRGPIVDICPKCKGLWLDADELKTLNKALGGRGDPFREIMADMAAEAKSQERLNWRDAAPVTLAAALGARGALTALPNLALGSLFVLSGLYFMLFVIFVAASLYAGIGIHLAALAAIVFIFFQYLISPPLMDFMLRLIQSLQWVKKEDLPPAMAAFIETVCKRHEMPFPRVGIIRDGAPNAFTYGHTPRNARVVVTEGLLNILDEDEVNAVVAHELGHARHWDILVMTLAGMVPVILYYIYRLCIEFGRGGSSDSKKAGAPIAAIGLAAFICYAISEYIVLYLSRIREYYADRFAGENTGSPNMLASALVKIAYGLAGREPEKKKGGKGDKEKRKPTLESVKAFGIFDPTSARAVAAASAGMTGGLDPENAERAMQWDLWNPWAVYYELNSTHPLPAKRINALSRQAKAYGQPPAFEFRLKKPESYWDEFFIDLLVMYLPLLCAGAGALAGMVMDVMLIPGLAVLGYGIGYSLNLGFAYRARSFLPMSIAALLRKVKVSNVRPVPVAIEGTIIGRGVPGLIWSEDMVLQDDSGFIFMDYRQPLRILEFLFGLFRTNKFMGKEATVTGWYRRAPVPYLEVRTVTVDGKKNTCWVYALKRVLAVLSIFIGVGLIMLVGPAKELLGPGF